MDLCSLVARFVLVVCSLGLLAAALPNVLTSNDNRIVIAHYIIGNTFPYTVDDWKRGSFASFHCQVVQVLTHFRFR